MKYYVVLVFTLLSLTSCFNKDDDWFGGSDGGIKTVVQGVLINKSNQMPIANHLIELQEQIICFLCAAGSGKHTIEKINTDQHGNFYYEFFTKKGKSYSIQALSDTNFIGILNYSISEGNRKYSRIEAVKSTVTKVTIRNRSDTFPPNDYSTLYFSLPMNDFYTMKNLYESRGISISYGIQKEIDLNKTIVEDSVILYVYPLRNTQYSVDLRTYSNGKNRTYTKTIITGKTDTSFVEFDL